MQDGNSIALPEEELGELAELVALPIHLLRMGLTIVGLQAESDAKEFLDELDTNKDGFLSLKVNVAPKSGTNCGARITVQYKLCNIHCHA